MRTSAIADGLKVRLKGRRIVIWTATLGLLALGGGGVVAATGSAFAGVNGQQINILDSDTTAFPSGTVYADGYNQDGAYKGTQINLDSKGGGRISGYWWKDEVTLTF